MYLSPAMRLSNYFLPTLRDNPAEAEIVSHRLMLRAGMVTQASAGIYAWLPLGFRVLSKIAALVREEQDRAGAHEILMPTIQSAELWKKSGRYEDYGRELLRFVDRHERPILYGPTNEEMITDIFARQVTSYRHLPQMLYHIQWKFRDEVRPRFGVMRGREFLMKDGYSFDLDVDAGRHSYNKMFVAYLRSFGRMGLRAIPMAADTGPIGGDLSHEFIILAETGESEVFCDKRILDHPMPASDIAYHGSLQALVDQWTGYYAATEELHDTAQFEAKVPPEQRLVARGIEVGHIFFFGSKYSETMGAFVTNKAGEKVPVQMGSYGIGVSRLVGAIIEACHDDKGIVWPDKVAPFQVGLINLRQGDSLCDNLCDEIFAKMPQHGCDILYDDRNERAGVKFNDMDLIGCPWQIIIGPKGAKQNLVDLQRRDGIYKETLPLQAAIDKIIAP